MLNAFKEVRSLQNQTRLMSSRKIVGLKNARVGRNTLVKEIVHEITSNAKRNTKKVICG